MSKILSRITVALLLALTVVVLVINVRYLYVAPVPNTWTWWAGDETWLLSVYKTFILTGHYVNTLAPGSIYSQCSGMIFGSCYLTAVIYAVPLLFIKGHTIDTGRTITFLLSIFTLSMLWMIAKRYGVSLILRAFGCLLLASTVCFFMMSHSARSDMLIGLVALILTGSLPLIVEKPFVHQDVLLGLLLPASLLINGHVLIISCLMLGYLFWDIGGFRSKRSIIRCAVAAAGGFIVLILIQAALLGSLSVFGPFTDDTGNQPFARLLHPRAHLTNYIWRLFIVKLWAPGMIWVAVLLAAALLWGRMRYRVRISQMGAVARRLLVCTTLVVIASIYLEYYWPRYLIYVLPAIVLSFLVVISFLMKTLPRSSRFILGVGLSVCLVFSLWRYEVETTRLGTVGEIISSANKESVTEALIAIHAHSIGRPRVFAAVPGQYIAMDDSCDLLTPVLYDWPINKSETRQELWKRAKIDYAIIYHPAHGRYDWRQTDSSIDPVALSRSRLIFERIGPITDIDRPYDPVDLKLSDTLRVYEFQ